MLPATRMQRERFPASTLPKTSDPLWIETLAREYVADVMGESVKAHDVFLAFTLDQGGNVVNACRALGIPVIKCNCHRVNSEVLSALGIAGNGHENKNIGDLMKTLAALVVVFIHSANNEKMKEFQRLEDDLHQVYELIRRTTRGGPTS